MTDLTKTFNPVINEAIERLTSPQGWQPIETAPKDNKVPLYLARFDADGKLQELDFDGGWEYWSESWEMAHINGWAWVSANGIEEPTHWAPMTAPIPQVTKP